jgi:hypothetical protein
MASELERINKIGKKVGVENIEYSTRPNKRFMVTITTGKKTKTVHFGQPGATTYFDDPTLTKKRDAFRARHSKIKLKDGRYAYQVFGTPAFLSYFILW